MIWRGGPVLMVLLAACGDDLLGQVTGPRAAADAGARPPVTALPDLGPAPDAAAVPDARALDATAAPDRGFADASPADLGLMDAGLRDAGVVGTPDAGSPGATECYTEPFDPTVSLGDLESDYRARRRSALDTLIEALRRRYPAGHDLLVAERNDPYTGTFIDRSNFGTVMESAMTEVHEATHGWDYRHSLFRRHFDYWLRGDLQHSLSFDVDGFPRSRIRPHLEDDSTSLYSGTYLTGDQGTRGLLELLDEMNCYINGLGAIAAIGEHVPFGISGRDGAVAFLYYLQVYLRRARLDDPPLYARMLANAALKEHVKIQWLRAHFFLLFADMTPRIGIRDGDIRRLLYRADNLNEISMLLGRCVDASNCLCD